MKNKQQLSNKQKEILLNYVRPNINRKLRDKDSSTNSVIASLKTQRIESALSYGVIKRQILNEELTIIEKEKDDEAFIEKVVERRNYIRNELLKNYATDDSSCCVTNMFASIKRDVYATILEMLEPAFTEE